MSYEGYWQCICQNGHYYTDGADAYNEEEPCGICKTPSAWRNQVDETNCDSWGEIPFDLLKKNFLISEEVIETCNLGHRHITKHAIFRIPVENEADPLRHRRAGDGRSPLVPINKP